MKWLVGLAVPALMLTSAAVVPAQEAAEPEVEFVIPPGGFSVDDLGNALRAMGLKPQLTEQRYDFAFQTSVRGEEWKFSMSTVLSRNGKSMWVMAWLDQIPQTSAEVPRTALLRLLAANDRMGNGKFFAYIPTNRRFVLQRVVPNRDMSTRELAAALQDLATSVADEHGTWHVANWVRQSAPTDESASAVVPTPNRTAARQSTDSTQTSESSTKYDGRRIN